MKTLILMVVALTLVGCGKEQEKNLSIDPALQPYYNSFVNEGARRGKGVSTDDLVLEFGTMPQAGVIGVCYRSTKTTTKFMKETTVRTPVIHISRARFDAAQDYERRDLIFHELGHCILNLEHNDNSFNGLPESIMNTYSVAMWVGRTNYLNYQRSYIDQLFGMINLAISQGAVDNGYAVASRTPPPQTITIENNGGEAQRTVYVSRLTGCDEHEQPMSVAIPESDRQEEITSNEASN